MICLGIESTAHTFGVGIIKGKKVLANVKDAYTTESGGIIPFKLLEHHTDVANKVLDDAFEKANISIKDVDLVSYSRSPGIGSALRVGSFVARYLGIKYNVPVVGVNHCIAHLEIGNLMTAAKDPVLLYASGANTQIIAYEAEKYRIFGETLDNGVGNFIDSFAREIGLGFPGGPQVEKIALGGKFIELPYTVKGMDVSFGGLLTNLKHKVGKFSKKDLCFSLQETVFAMLVEVSERAMAHTSKKELLLGGGVACNKRLQEMCKVMCRERGAKFYCPSNEFLVDNGAMIAWLGILSFNGKGIKVENAGINPYERTDEVKVTWK
jgi:N6-L-threonylcarbamoyladenine synthase